MPLHVSDAEILAEHARATLESVHTAQPGLVVAYYPDTCTADVQPALKRPLLDEDGAIAAYEQLPVIPGVPVCFPRGGGFHMTFPLLPGDSVLLVIAEGAIGEWHDAADVVEPGDVRRHGLSGAFCMPGGWPRAKPPNDASVAADALVVGRDGHPEQIRIPAAGGSISLGASATHPVAFGDGLVTLAGLLNTWVGLANAALLKVPVPMTGPEQTAINAALTAITTYMSTASATLQSITVTSM